MRISKLCLKPLGFAVVLASTQVQAIISDSTTRLETDIHQKETEVPSKQEVITQIVMADLEEYLPRNLRMSRVFAWLRQRSITPAEVDMVLNRIITSVIGAFEKRGYVPHMLVTRPTDEEQGEVDGGIVILMRLVHSKPTLPSMQLAFVLHSESPSSTDPNIYGGVGPLCVFQAPSRCGDTSTLKNSYDVIRDISEDLHETFVLLTLEDLSPSDKMDREQADKRKQALEKETGLSFQDEAPYKPWAFYMSSGQVTPIKIDPYVLFDKE